MQLVNTSKYYYLFARLRVEKDFDRGLSNTLHSLLKLGGMGGF